MGRLYWKRTLVSSVAWAGLALGQQPLSSSPQATSITPAAKSTKTLTIQEQGKSLKCRVVEAWRLPSGNRAYQAQVLDTGEMITIVQEGQATPVSTLSSGQKLQALKTQIYHWADPNTPHPDAPRPPMALRPAPAPVQLVGHPTTPAASPSIPASAPQTISVPGENGKSYQCKVLKTWQTSQGTVAYQVQSVETGELMTVEDGVTVPGPNGKMMSGGMHIFRWSADKTPPPNAPVPPGGYVHTPPAVAAVLPPPVPSGVTSAPPTLSLPAPAPAKMEVASLPAPTASAKSEGVPALPPPPPPPPPPPTGPAPLEFEVPGNKAANSSPAPTLPAPKPAGIVKPTTTVTTSVVPAGPAVVGAQAVPLPGAKSTSATTSASAPWPKPVESSTLKPADTKPTTSITSKATDVKPTTTVSKASDTKPITGTASKATDVKPTTTTVSKPTDTRSAGSAAEQTASAAKPEAKSENQPKIGDRIKGLFGGDKDSSNTQTTTETKSNEWRSSWGKADDHKTKKPSEERALPHSTTANAKDPIQGGDQVKKSTVESKLQNFGKTAEKDVARIDAPKTSKEATAAKPVEPSRDATAPAQATAASRVPLGSGSVLAAGNAPGQVQYVPVPMIQMPTGAQAPVIPSGPPPQPPQPILQRPVAPTPNAFSAPQPAAPAGMTYNAFTPTPGAMPVPQGQYVAQGQRPMPQGMMQPQAMIQPQGQAATPMAPTHTQVAYTDRRPTTPSAPTAASSQQMQEMLTTLKDSLYPSQREWAADTLSKMDWKLHPEIVLALLTGAREDPAPMVRASCVRCLARMQVSTAPVLSALQSLKSDSDARVRVEAEKACGLLGAGQSVQPVGYQVPGK